MEDKVIFHIDINHCYAQIEEMKYPELRFIPMAVGGHEEKRHGIILAKNDLAKKAGIKTGESLREAYEKCPDLLIIPPAYNDYIYYSQEIRKLYQEYTDHVEPFGLDEAWLDFTGSTRIYGDPCMTAARIQQRVLREFGLTVSVGISWNKAFAKLGSDLKKPSGMTVITRDNYKDIVWPRPASDLLYVGYATEKKLRSRGIYTIGQLANYPVHWLKESMGIAGEVISAFANGEDRSNVAETFFRTPVKSVGNAMTLIHDVNDADELRPAMYVLCEAVASRLKDHDMEGCVISVSARSGGLEWYGKQRKIPQPTNVSEEILKTAMELIEESYDFSVPLRAAGVSVSQLHPWHSKRQLSLFADEEAYDDALRIDTAMDRIREQYGFYSVRRACTLIDRPLTEFNPKGDHTVYPIGYFRGRKMSDGII